MVDPPGASPVDPCPLCRNRDAERICAIPYSAIWKSHERVWGAHFSQDVVARHQRGDEAVLYRCSSCGLEYFSPLIPGDADFYRELMTCTPYPPARWEFAVVADRLAPESSVVDLGCGDGAFLQSIRSRVARVAGIDHNPDGIARLARAGIEAEVRDFRSFADREAGAFDVACSFHTLEHLPRVDGLIEAAATCVRPSGRIFVSVPNRDRFGREELEPMDCPPHHMSRWSREQLPLIADRFGLELVAVRVEEPDLSHARKAYRPKSLPALGDHDPLGRVVTAMRLSSRRYARLAHEAAFTARGLFGHGILAEFRRPR